MTTETRRVFLATTLTATLHTARLTVPSHSRRPRSVAGACVLAAVAILAVIPLGCCGDALYELTAAKPKVSLPKDEAPHCFGGEWWYYTGRVTTEDGRGFGIQAVVFYVPILPAPISAEGWVAHYAVVDETEGTFAYDQSLSLGRALDDEPPPIGFELSTPLVQLAGSEGHDRIHAGMSNGTYGVALELEDERGPVLHGDDGYISYGSDGSSFYYSRPKMNATGTLVIDGEARRVTGSFWFDRQWGVYLVNPWQQWDWFSVRLDDGANIMLFVFPDETSSQAAGTYIPPVGEPVTLAGDDFVITPTNWWTSPHTGITYPVAWTVQLIPQGLTLAVTAVSEDQELDARASSLNIYWEGLCTVTSGSPGDHASGSAYVELANYPR